MKDAVLDALDLPIQSRVERRVPKKVLLDRAATSTADRSLLRERLQELLWVAILKPTTVGLAATREGARVYEEVAILHSLLAPGRRTERLEQILHAAIPYPVLLVIEDAGALRISLAHKTDRDGNEPGLAPDETIVSVTVREGAMPPCWLEFLRSLSLSATHDADLGALFRRWEAAIVALAASRITGTFKAADSHRGVRDQRANIQEYMQLQATHSRLLAAAVNEVQLARRVDLNLEIKRTEALLAQALEKL